MKIGITGYSGYVGRELLKFPDASPLAGDIRKMNDIRLAVKSVRPDIIVHLAAITDVDKCEKPENQKLVDETNVRGAFNVCHVAEEYGCEVVILSTFQVFNGKKGNYIEKSDPDPVNYYGFSKMGAEGLRDIFECVKVVRVGYLFDYERMVNHIHPLRAKHPYEYPTFIERSFMHLSHFADSFYSYLNQYNDMPKMLHIASRDSSSWYEFMQRVANVYKLDCSLVRPRNYELKEMTPRPYRGGLSVRLSQGLRLPQYSYEDGLQEMIQ